MKNIISTVLLCAFLTLNFQTAFARQSGDWNAVKNLLNAEIAVKTRSGKTVFGVLRAADDNELQLQIADRKVVNSAGTVYRRDEIEKIWRARLRFGGRQITKGALIGATAGAGIGTGVFLANRKNDDDGLAGAVIPLAMIYGAGIGAVVGIFSKKSHKKANLVYSI